MKKFIILLCFCSLIHGINNAQQLNLKSGFGNNNGFEFENLKEVAGTSITQGGNTTKVQPDGKLLVSGSSATAGFITRFNTDGTIDPTFGNNGRTTVFAGRVSKMLIQSDGKIVVGCTLSGPFAILRFNSDGSPDDTFATGGFFSQQFAMTNYFGDFVLQPDGKLVIVGSVGNIDPVLGYTVNKFIVIRLSATGALDPAFNGTGSKVFQSQVALRSAVDLDFSDPAYPTGKIVATGGKSGKIFFLRLLPDASSDVTLNASGYFEESFANAGFSYLKVLPSGKFVAGGYNYDNTTFSFQLFLSQYTVTGLPDASFGTSGRIVNSLGNVKGLELLNNGKIVVVSDRTGGSPGSTLSISRYTTAGLLDVSFNSTGRKTFVYNSANFDGMYALAISPAGDYYAVGETQTNTGSFSVGIAKFTTAGAFDNSFNVNGIKIYNFLMSSDNNFGVATQADGKIYITGETTYYIPFTTTRQSYIMRKTAAGQPDATWGVNGVKYFTDAIGNGLITVQPDGKVLIVFGGQIKRFNADGSNDNTFNGNGTVGYPPFGTTYPSAAKTVKLDAAGNIYVCFPYYFNDRNYTGIVKFTNSGVRIMTYAGGNGVALYGNLLPAAMDLLPDGSTLITGTLYNNTGSAISGGLIKFNAAGQFDPAFNSGTRVAIGGYTSVCTALTLDATGKILVAGHSFDNYPMFITRLTSTGAVDLSFGTNGITVTKIPNTTEQSINNLFVQTDGTILVAGGLNLPEPRRNIMVFRYLSTGIADPNVVQSNGLFSPNLKPGSAEVFTSFIQKLNTIYAVGYIETDKQGDALIVAIDVPSFVLPVKYTDFSVSKLKNTALVNWRVASEQNIKYYEVQRSTDASNFTTIGKVNAYNNGAASQKYSYTDASPYKGINYYRVAAINADGKIELSKTGLVSFTALPEIMVFPNPVANVLQIKLNSVLSSTTSLMIINGGGQILQTIKNNGALLQTIDVSALLPGNYFLRSSEGWVQSFLKK